MASSAPGMKNPFGRPIVIADLSEETGRVREELPRIERKLGTIGLDPMVIRAETPTECERRRLRCNCSRSFGAIGLSLNSPKPVVTPYSVGAGSPAAQARR